jgi:hypothetical protein
LHVALSKNMYCFMKQSMWRPSIRIHSYAGSHSITKNCTYVDSITNKTGKGADDYAQHEKAHACARDLKSQAYWELASEAELGSIFSFSCCLGCLSAIYPLCGGGRRTQPMKRDTSVRNFRAGWTVVRFAMWQPVWQPVGNSLWTPVGKNPLCGNPLTLNGDENGDETWMPFPCPWAMWF